MDNVLGSARIGLIFTRIQEGAQPGGLTPPGQTEQGIPYHVPSCWVPVRGCGGVELPRRLGAWAAAVRESGSVGCAVCVVFSPCLYHCCSCFPSICCCVKLPLSRPTSFLPVSFHSPPHPGGGRGGRVVLLLQPQPNHNTL